MNLLDSMNFFEFTLTEAQVHTSIVGFALVWFLVGSVGVLLFKNDQKKLQWVISLVNSFTLMVVGLVYMLIKVPTFNN